LEPEEGTDKVEKAQEVSGQFIKETSVRLQLVKKACDEMPLFV
jgi:hypothetical protein